MRSRFLTILVALALLLSACGPDEPTATGTPVPTDTPIIAPTLTATPVVPLAILVLPADFDSELSSQYQKTVYDLAQASGLRFQLRNALTAADLNEPGLKIVIVFPPDPGIVSLAAAAPQVQFLAINIPGATAGGNLSVLGGNSQTDIAAFVAGYTASMLTNDYRIGMMMPKDNADALRALNAYATGRTYFCGLCRPFYYLPWGFPQFIEIPTEEDKANYDAYADILIQQYKVGTIFLYPDISIPELYEYVGTTGVYMIGTIPPEPIPAGWVMTIQPDVVKAIQNAWSQLVAGQGGVTVQSPLGLSDVDPGVLSPGKQLKVQKVLDDVQAGRISIFPQ